MTLKRFTRIHLAYIDTSFSVVNLTLGQDLPIVKPEEVGFSAKRLGPSDEAFNGYVKDNKMAGSVILVSRKGKVAYYKAFGFRDLEAKSAMTKEAIFRIASQTKAIVSTGIMILQEEGKLLIQDPLSKYLPEFKETLVAQQKGDGGYEVVKGNPTHNFERFVDAYGRYRLRNGCCR